MATTYTLISSNTLTSTTASVTFSSIPATYTDLVLRASTRATTGTITVQPTITFNGTGGTAYSRTYLRFLTSASFETGISSSQPNLGPYMVNGATSAASTFSNTEIYIPNYTLTVAKPMSFSGTIGNNTSTGQIDKEAWYFSNTAAITSITLTASFASDSSFYLYGIKNS